MNEEISINISKNLQGQADAFHKALLLLGDKLFQWFEQAVLLLPNLIIAILLILLSIVLAQYFSSLSHRFLKKYFKNKALAEFLLTLTKLSIVFFGVLLATSVLHLDKALTSLLAGLGILGVTLGFAFQDITTNFISGIAMAIKVKYPFAVGDIIQSRDIIGNVEHINLRSTTIRTFQGQIVMVPNRLIYENPITNFSFLGMRRVDLKVGISYRDDLEKVQKIVLESVQDIEDIVKDKPLEFYYKAFGESSIDFEIRFWVNFTKQTEYLNAQHLAIIAIKKAFDANGITIPFPIRTIEMAEPQKN
jgi:small conductance mechanosensitive channel